jgi:YHS domain-containing protein
MNRFIPQAGRVGQKILIFSQLALAASVGIFTTSWSVVAWAEATVAIHQNLDDEGYAINRYDPVGYFIDGKAIRGSTEFTTTFEGAKYAFASAGNLKIFMKEPKKYKPQYGGYCAYGLVYGSKSSIDPEQWEIVDGRLYFMINPGTMSIWQKSKNNYIKIADKAWKNITK